MIACTLLILVTFITYGSCDDGLALAQLEVLSRHARENQLASMSTETGQTCTSSNLVVRREWGTLTAAERIAYTDAVLCLQKKSALTPNSLIPGARSRFDDFVGTHINQTVNIHFTGTFLAWHRYFIWSYEQALINECGYAGTQPYWDWGLQSSNTLASPVFDGSATSMSGNGAVNIGRLSIRSAVHRTLNIHPGASLGGCVTTGPFKDMIVNLGPVPLPLSGNTKLNGTGLGYNPRCLRRDINSVLNQDYANATSIVNLINQNQNIHDFQNVMQGGPGSGTFGVHNAGHYTIGGDPGGDSFVSPGDPAFYVHHSMIDRVWWMWQNLDPANRTNAISGTGTLLNNPPSPDITLDTVIDLGCSGSGPISMRDLMSTTNGPFCYQYV